jgi:hypothetical protein
MVSREDRERINYFLAQEERARRDRESAAVWRREAEEQNAWMYTPEAQAAFREERLKSYGSAFDEKREMEANGCPCGYVYTNDAGMSTLQIRPLKECREHGWSDAEETRREATLREEANRHAEAERRQAERTRIQRRNDKLATGAKRSLIGIASLPLILLALCIVAFVITFIVVLIYSAITGN